MHEYLNNIIEQDHRFIKRRTRPMLGFKRFTTAWRPLRGIEIMHALRKGQARWMAKGDVVGQTQLIHKVFGLAVVLTRSTQRILARDPKPCNRTIWCTARSPTATTRRPSGEAISPQPQQGGDRGADDDWMPGDGFLGRR